MSGYLSTQMGFACMHVALKCTSGVCRYQNGRQAVSMCCIYVTYICVKANLSPWFLAAFSLGKLKTKFYDLDILNLSPHTDPTPTTHRPPIDTEYLNLP